MAAFTLEGKPWYYGIGIGLALAVGVVWIAHWQLIGPTDDDIRVAEGQIKDLDTKIEQGKSAQRKLPQFREEVRRPDDVLDQIPHLPVVARRRQRELLAVHAFKAAAGRRERPRQQLDLQSPLVRGHGQSWLTACGMMQPPSGRSMSCPHDHRG